MELTREERYSRLHLLAPSLISKEARALDLAASLPGSAWARHFWPHLFSRPFTNYQNEYWDFIDTVEPDTYYRPRVECEPRGVGKSTNAEASACKLIATKKRKMIGYVSLEETKATKHFESIKAMMETERFVEAYPHCQPKVQKLRSSVQQWSRDAIVTQSGAMVVPITLLGSSRGWKSAEGVRFDVLFLDDIDKIGQSPELIRKLIELLKGEILAAGSDKTLIVMPQNLIHRDSICSQILDHRADILSDRIFCGPYPLLEWYEAEKVDIQDDESGAKQWIITDGKAFDPAIDLGYATGLLNLYGRATFDRECQQEVFKVDDEKDFREWDEVYHVITYSEFKEYFEKFHVPVWNPAKDHPQIPHNWNVGMGLDWGTTIGHPAVCAPFARPNQLSPLNDCFFAFTEVVLPKYPLTVGEEVPLVSPGRVSGAIKQALKEWNVSDGQVKMQLMSHEASAALNTMIVDLPEELKSYFNKWKPKRGSGVPQIQNLLEIDRTKDHPFRKGIKGAPRLFFIVPDDQGKLIQLASGKYMVAQPKDYQGFARARFEIPNYSQFNTGSNKRDDDYVDAALGIMNRFGVSSARPSLEEREEAKIAEPFRLSVIEREKENLSDEELSQRYLTHQVKLNIPKAIANQNKVKVNSRISRFKK
jgi:hypothetical protein